MKKKKDKRIPRKWKDRTTPEKIAVAIFAFWTFSFIPIASILAIINIDYMPAFIGLFFIGLPFYMLFVYAVRPPNPNKTNYKDN